MKIQYIFETQKILGKKYKNIYKNIHIQKYIKGLRKRLKITVWLGKTF